MLGMQVGIGIVVAKVAEELADTCGRDLTIIWYGILLTIKPTEQTPKMHGTWHSYLIILVQRMYI